MLNTNCGVYAITSPSGKAYVGSARNIQQRWATHRYQLRRNKHHCTGLQHAFNKYGESALTFAKIAFCSIADLAKCEQEQMDARGRAHLYNSRPIAESNLGLAVSPAVRAKIAASHKGKKHDELHRANVAAAKRNQTAETRAKISAALKGRQMPEASKAALLAANTGRKMPAAQIEKIRSSNLGKKRSPETKARLAAARTGRRHSEETLAKLRKPCSPETKAKIAEAQKRRHAALREVQSAE